MIPFSLSLVCSKISSLLQSKYVQDSQDLLSYMQPSDENEN